MKYTVDEIINGIVTLIDLKTGIKEYENIDIMPDKLEENDVVIYKNDIYFKDEKQKKERLDIINKKMEMLKNINKLI